MAREIKLDPQIMSKLDDMKTLVGPGYRSYSFTINEDAEGISYSTTASDDSGNSVSVNERRVKKNKSPL